MAINPDTLELINYIKDVEFEFNMKLLLICTIFLWCVWAWWFSYKIEINSAWKLITRNIIMRAMTLPYLFFSPMLIGFLYRGVAFEKLFIFLLVIYGILYIFIQVLFFLFGAEWLLKFFGVEDLSQFMQSKPSRRYKT